MRLSYYLILTALLAGCEARQPAITAKPALPPSPTPAPVSQAVSLVPEAKGATTTIFGKVYYGQMWAGPPDTTQRLPQLTIDGQRRQVRTTARADSTRPLVFAIPADLKNHQPATVEKGLDVVYTFQLLSPNGQARFTKKLRKADFTFQVR